MRRSISTTVCLAAMYLPGSAIAQQQDFSKVEVTATEIRPGVAVLFGQGGNIGVGYGNDATVLIDDQFAPLTKKIQAAVASLGASPTRFLINTHWHFDHTGGNENLGTAGATIFAHDNVRVRLASGGTLLGMNIEPAPAAALPVVTYGQGVTFHLNGDTIDVRFVGGGHTDGDSVIHWHKANVLHTGDLFMNGLGFPFVDTSSGGNAIHLLNSLDRVIAMTDDETAIIPGHGALATRSDLIAFRTMVGTAVDRVKALKASGISLEEATKRAPLKGLRNGEGFVSDDQFVEAIWRSLEAHGH